MEEIKFIYNKDKKIYQVKFNSNRSEQLQTATTNYTKTYYYVLCVEKICLTLMIQSKRKNKKNSNEWKIIFFLF